MSVKSYTQALVERKGGDGKWERRLGWLDSRKAQVHKKLEGDWVVVETYASYGAEHVDKYPKNFKKLEL